MIWGAFGLPDLFVYTAGSGATGQTHYVNAYTEDPSTGAGSLVAGSPFIAGPGTMVVASDPVGKFLYAGFQSGIAGYSIDSNSRALTPVPGSPFAFENLGGPGGASSAVVDTSGKFLYVAGSGYLSAFAIDPNTGALTQLSGYPVNSGAVAVADDPLGKFLYVSNGVTISTFNINPSTGALTLAAGPFGGGASYSFSTMAVTPNSQFLLCQRKRHCSL